MPVSTFPRRRRKPAKPAPAVPPIPAADPTPAVVPPDDSDDDGKTGDVPAVSLLFRIGDVIGMLALAARDRDDHRDAHVVLDGMASVLPGLYADVYAVIDAIREDSAVTWAARVQWRKSMGI